MLIRCVLVVIVGFVVTGCGKLRPSWEGKPSSIVSMDGLSQRDQELLRSAIASFNEQMGEEVIHESPTAGTFPVFIKKVPLTSAHPNRAGYATLEEEHCTIELTESLFTSAKLAYLEPVVWHEFGHCAGLGHVAEPNEIMSAQTERMSEYPESAVVRFFSSFRAATGL